MDSCLRIAELQGLPAAAAGSNFVYSPLSLRAALSLAAAGAREASLHQLLSFLGSPTLDHLNSAAVRLLRSVRAADEKDELLLSFVHGVWVERSVAVNPSFRGIASSVHGAAFDSVDFIHQAPRETKKINDWVDETTKGVIKKLIPDDSLDQSTRFVLANALYFKGRWEEKFDPSMTKQSKFHLLDGTTVQVPFMSSREEQLVSSFDGFKVLRLPYRNQGDSRSFSMLLFLPNERDGLHDLVKRTHFDADFIEKHSPYRRSTVLEFMVPKFKISFDFEASQTLVNLGLESIFGRDADFTGMCLGSSTEDGNPLFVSSIHHSAAIEVDEEGTTAAAATALSVRPLCYTPPENFVADHPFMFLVREDETGAVLFLGNVVNPLVLG